MVPVAAAAQDVPAIAAPGAADVVAPGVAASAALPATRTLPAFTPLVVMMDEPVTSSTHKLGDRFKVSVVADVTDQGLVVIPKGTHGYGEVTFVTKKGGFGKPGMLGIALRALDLNGKPVLLDGRYREIGKDGDGAASATMFMVGIFAVAVTGKTSVIPQGRELKAHTGEDIIFPIVSAPAAVPEPAPATPAIQPAGDTPPAAAQASPATAN